MLRRAARRVSASTSSAARRTAASSPGEPSSLAVAAHAGAPSLAAAERAVEREVAAASASASDTRTLAYALGFLSSLPFLALTPSGFERLSVAAQQAGFTRENGHTPALDSRDRGRLQILYASSILSFLGAPHWGLAMAAAPPSYAPLANVLRLAWGVTPSLVAVPVPALPETTARQVLVFSLLGCCVADGCFARLRLLPRWYFVGLRLPLTAVAVGSLCANVLERAHDRRDKTENLLVE